MTHFTCLCRVGDAPPKWYKFDDGEVAECKMDDDEEMKNQCFGGEYLGEVFDHMLKRYTSKYVLPSLDCDTTLYFTPVPF